MAAKRTTTTRRRYTLVRRAGSRARSGGRRGIGMLKGETMQKVLKGVGGGLIAGKVDQRVAPQYTTIAALGGGYLAGGGMGAIASFLVNTGVLDNLLSGGGLGGLLGGGAASPAQQAVRSL